MSLLRENLERLEESIGRACCAAGRGRGEIEMMAVSKTYPAEIVLEAAGLGLSLFGESRVREFSTKALELEQLRQPATPAAERLQLVSGHDFSCAENAAESARTLQAAEKLVRAVGQGFIPGITPTESTQALAPEGCSLPLLTQNRPFSAACLAPEVSFAGQTHAASHVFAANSRAIRIHLIGHLQSNKAARAAELFDAVDSLDSLRLAEKLNEAASKLGKRVPVLIEVKLSHEETKAGLEPESPEAARLLERLPELAHLETRGLMTIAPWGVAEDATRACFRSLRLWRDRWAAEHPRLKLDVLSMGMSGDFALAIEEGATRVRVGTAIFGARSYAEPA